ncbi:MAG TPA: hypothetical protein VG078_00600 [Acidimicrobiales bacterium]|nr:hypothetical protein [Acidimicrobiales bacterium]
MVLTRTTIVCLFAGLLLGLAFATGGVGGLVMSVLLGAAGVVAAKVLEGEIDLTQLLPEDRRPSR